MALVDERGRFFGRVNVIDASVAVLLLLLIPLGYGAYRLFRTPSPRIVSVEPATLTQGQDLRVRIHGQDLRPFLRASVGAQQATLLVESPSQAEISVPALEPGTYDLVLYDEAQEVFRLPAALTIERQKPLLSAISRGTMLEPIRLVAGKESTIQLQGEFLRPSFHALIGTLRVELKVENSGRGEIRTPALGAGVYDLSLHDGPLEVARWPDLIVIEEPRLEPVKLTAGAAARVLVQGDGFNPNLRAFVGGRPAGLRVDSGQQAQITLPALEPGTYDLVLVDGNQEVARRPAAFTIERGSIRVSGGFTGLGAKEARTLASVPAGALTPFDWGEIIAVQPPEPDVTLSYGSAIGLAGTSETFRVTALIRVECLLINRECRLGNTVVAPGVVVWLSTAAGMMPFHVEEVYPPDATPVEVVVRFVMRPEVLALVEDSMVAGGAIAADAERVGPALISLDGIQDVLGRTTVDQVEFDEQLKTAVGVLRVPAQKMTNGWQYKNTPIRAGGRFTFETTAYTLQGTVLAVRVQGADGGSRESEVAVKPRSTR